MSKEKRKLISVTHFINPHLFWYHKIHVPNKEFDEIVQLEDRLQLYHDKNPAFNSYCPKVDDLVVVNFLAWNKLIRAQVQHISQSLTTKEYIVWAIDYGFPFQTKECYIRRLPEASYTKKVDHIRCGGLSKIQCAEKEFDFNEGRGIVTPKDAWNQRACDVLEKLLTEASSITFVEDFQIGSHIWGDLIIVNHLGKRVSACEFLIEIDFAMLAKPTFRETCLKLKSTQILPWLSNNGNSKFKMNNVAPHVCGHGNVANRSHCDDFAKRKVEDWHERNEKAAAVLESHDSNVEVSTIDDVSFDDSVSRVRYLPTSSSVSDATEATMEIENQFVRKAGALTKSKQTKYGNKQMPPKPNSMAFEIHPDKEAQNVPHSSSSSNITNISNRRKQLMETSQKIAGKRMEQSIMSTEYVRLEESTFNSVDANERKPLNMHQSTFDDSKSTTESTSDISVLSSRVKKHLQLRLHQNYGSPTDSTEASADKRTSSAALQKPSRNRERTDQSNIAAAVLSPTIPPKVSKHREHLLKVIEAKAQASSPDQQYKDETSDAISVTSFSRTQHLANIRKKVSVAAAATARKQHEPPDLTSTYTNSSKQNATNPFSGIRMVPAGYDLINLNRYNDEKNHWHRKKTTLNDYVPHDDYTSSAEDIQYSNSTSSEMNSTKSSNDNNRKTTSTKLPNNPNFRHTRYHTDKYKEENKVKASPKNILDSTVPDINDELLQLSGNDERKSELFPRTREDVKADSSSSSPNTPNTATTMLRSKRRQLKSPALQKTKMDQIIRRANFEKKMGNDDILDLNNINSSGSKTDSEIDDAVASTSGVDIADNRKVATASNTRALIVNRLKRNDNNENSPDTASTHSSNICSQPGPMKENHLKYLEERLEREIKLTKNINKKVKCFQIELPMAQEIREVEGEKNLQTKFIDHLVLAHSKVPLNPLEKISEAFFLKEIHDEMVNMRITKVYRIQAYAWSHLLRGNSLCIINPTKTGKTWSYLPPICSLVSYRIQSGTLPQTYGPVAIILVPSSAAVEQVSNNSRRLLMRVSSAVTTVSSFGVRNYNDGKIQLLNSCGILIATPASLLRLLEDNEDESLIDPKRLQHFVIDDLDMMLSRSQKDIKAVLTTIFKMCKKSGSSKISLQLVVTSRDWDPMIMVAMLRRSNQPLALIGDFLEAAVYGKVNILIQLRSVEQKIPSILRYIEKQPLERERLLIFCNCDADVNNVVDTLTMAGYVCIAYCSQSTAQERTFIDEWKNEKVSSSRILVCTDDAFPELKIQNVGDIIHYSMPNSWTKFTTRFSALAQTYENYVSKDFSPTATTSNETKAFALILLDEENSLHLPRLMDFMKKHNQLDKIHPDILAVSKRVLVEREEARITKGSLMCPFVLEFGECDESRCEYRHNLTRFDVISRTDQIPTTGQLKIFILKVFSPTHYTARLLQHQLHDGDKWYDIRRSREVCNFGMKLNLHYMDTSNWNIPHPLELNCLYVYKVSDSYQRVRLLEMPEIMSLNVIKQYKVTVKLIDVGIVISGVKSDALFICHDKFKDFPAQAIDIRLRGIVPFDNERSWDSKGTKAVQNWIMNDITKNQCVHVPIDFALANTIWVNNVIVLEKLPSVGRYVYHINLRRNLVEKNFGLIDTMKRHSVRDIAEEMGWLNMQNTETEMDFESCNNDSSNLIKFSSIEDETFESDVLNGEEAEMYAASNKSKEIEAFNTNELAKEKCEQNENWDNLSEANRENEIFRPLQSANENERAEKFTEIDTTFSVIKETWCDLPLHFVNKVEIGDENDNGNWSNIYLQCIDNANMKKFEQLQEMINEHIANLKTSPDYNFPEKFLQPMQSCIVKYSEIYLRAKLHGIFGEQSSECIYRFFLCDYACFVTMKADKLHNDFLYTTTMEIIEFTPYQAVHCTLAGIQLESFAKRFKVTKDYLFAYAVARSELPANVKTENFDIHSFEILLYECDTENSLRSSKILNKELVENGVAVLDVETKHYLELDIGVDLAEFDVTDEEKLLQNTASGSSEEKVYNFQELLQCLQRSFLMDVEELENKADDDEKLRKTLLETKAICAASIDKQRSQRQDIVKTNPNKITKLNTLKKTKSATRRAESPCKSDEEPLLSSASINSDNGDATHSLSSLSVSKRSISPPPQLSALCKRPQTTWYETDCLIYLVIDAPDIDDYFLEVTETTLLFATVVNGEEKSLILNFLGTVQPQYVSHEIRGLNVIVRLVKSICMKWPRLLEQSLKFSWLTYNFNTIDTTEIEHLLPQQRLEQDLQDYKYKAKYSTDSDDSDDGEKNLYQTFTPIFNSEDVHDPTAELF